MSHIMYGYRKDEKGRTIARTFNSGAIPEGWVDSPNKLDATPPELPAKRKAEPDLTPSIEWRGFDEPKKRETLRMPRK